MLLAALIVVCLVFFIFPVYCKSIWRSALVRLTPVGQKSVFCDGRRVQVLFSFVSRVMYIALSLSLSL